MKKILTLALCLSAVGAINAQKATVEMAGKLAGKLDKVEEARDLIKQALKDPETANDVRTQYTAGKIEFKAFETNNQKLLLNREDPSINKVDLGTQLINGYFAYLKALPLDSLPNEKGQVKPKYSKEIVGTINAHHGDFYNYGGELFNNKHYYPEAYNAFMAYGDITSQPWADKNVKAVPDTMVALAYHYAGIGAFSGNALPEALVAFEKARKHGIKDPQNYVYEIACWQNLALRDSTLEEKAKNQIKDIALHGYETFGISNPLFINNLVNSMLQDKDYDGAIALITKQLSATPDKAFLYGLRGYVNDRKGDDDASLADYRKAASFDDADIETLKNAAKKIYTAGTVIWNNIEGNQPGKRQEVKTDYFEAAKAIAERAQSLNSQDHDVNYILENINYALETYF